MSQDWDPWNEVVQPQLTSLTQTLKLSRPMFDRLRERKLITDSEMKTLTDLQGERERSRMLLTACLRKQRTNFLQFCDVLLEMDDESQKKIGRYLRDAFHSRRGSQLSKSPGENSGLSRRPLETTSTEYSSCRTGTKRSSQSHSFSPQLGKIAKLNDREGEIQGIASSQQANVDDCVTTFAASQSTETVPHTGIAKHEGSVIVISNSKDTVLNVNPIINTSRHIHLSQASDKDLQATAYRPCLDEHFVGRNTVVQSLTDRLLEGSQNAVLVSGPPGIGKTAVANAVCLEYVKRNGSYRCYLIELHDLVKTLDDLYSLCCQKVAGTMRMSEIEDISTGDLKNLSKSILGTLPPGSLLVVDACEKAAAVPDLLASLLVDACRASNGQLRFLLTSQVAMNKHQLQLQSLHTEPLTPLSKQDSLQVLRYQMETETISDDVLNDMKAIGDLLEGVPLSLSLASTMFRSLEYTPRRLRTKLQTEGPSSAFNSEELGKGLRTVLDEFFKLLHHQKGPQEYHAAVSASIFPGTISQEAFYCVCVVSQSGEALPARVAEASVNSEMIATLKNWHVLERCRGTDVSDPRYQMHAYIKDYASSQLFHVSTTVREAFLVYYAHFLIKIAKQEEARQSLQDTGGLLALDRELENVNGFLTHLTDNTTMRYDSRVQQAVLEAITREDVGHLLSLRFPHDKRLATLKCVYHSVKTTISPQIKAGLLLEMAKILRGQGRFDEALEQAERAHHLCSKDPIDKERKASALEVLGSVKFRQDRSGFKDAETNLTAALRLGQENLREAKKSHQEDKIRKNTKRVASVCKTLGELYSRQGKFDDANAKFHDAEMLFSQLTGKEVLSVAWLKHRLGGNYQRQQKLDNAEEAYLEGLRLCKEYRAKKHAMYVKLNYSLGRLYQYHKKKDLLKSLEHYEIARSLQEELNPDHPDLVQTYIGIGRARNEMETDHETTLQLFQRARNLRDCRTKTPGQSDFTMAELCVAEARTYQLLGKYADELASLKQALKIYNDSREVGESIDKKAKVLNHMGHAHRRLGNKKEESSCFAESRRLTPKGKGKGKSRKR